MGAKDTIRWLRPSLRLVLFTLAYVLLRRVSVRLFVLEPALISSFWPPIGLALAALLRCDRRMAPAYALAILAANIGELLTGGWPLPVAVGWGFAATLEPVVGAVLILRFLPSPNGLARVQDVLGFVLFGAVIGPMVGGIAAAAVSARYLEGTFAPDWLRWWVGSGLGVVLAGPLFLSASLRRFGGLQLRRHPARLVELLVLLGLVAVVISRMASTPIEPPFNFMLASYATVPFFIWAALRLGMPGVAAAVALAACLTGWYITSGEGVFLTASAPAHEQLVAMQAFLAVGSISGLVLAAALEDRRRVALSQALLADAGALASESLDQRQALTRVARRLVPELADGCAFYLARGDGTMKLAAEADIAPALLPAVTHHVQRGPRSGEAFREPGTLDSYSMLAVPLEGRGQLLGWMVLLSRLPTGRLSPDERALAEELARRCALAIERAKLHQAQEEAVRARDDFLTIVSHELKTPLTPMSLQIAAMNRRLRAGKAVDPESVARLRRSMERLVRLINDLLDSSRAAAGRLSLTLEPMPLHALVQDVAAGFATASARHQLSVELPEEELWVRGDRARLEQVLSNLLENAIKYSPLGGVIEVSLEAGKGLARMTVSDQGIGVPPEQRKELFSRFFRARNSSSRSFGGLGLGLYISHDIVERHGGRIWMEGAPGGGSSFHVDLPLLHIGARRVATPEAPRPIPPPPA